MSIELMKQWLEALTIQSDRVTEIGKKREAITSLRQAIEQAEKQEPVAAQSRFSGDEWNQCSVEHAKMVMANPHEWKNYELRLLYTTPQPQRKWVGLTDEDRLHLVDTHVGFVSPSHPLSNDDWINYASAIEAILRSKNT